MTWAQRMMPLNAAKMNASSASELKHSLLNRQHRSKSWPNCEEQRRLRMQMICNTLELVQLQSYNSSSIPFKLYIFAQSRP